MTKTIDLFLCESRTNRSTRQSVSIESKANFVKTQMIAAATSRANPINRNSVLKWDNFTLNSLMVFLFKF